MILRELNDPRLGGLPSITRVQVTEDLAYADVYISVMGSEGKQVAALNALKHSAGLMRTKLSEMMQMRQVPYLKFHIDEKLKKEREILDLLRKVAEETAASDQAKADAAKAQTPTEPPKES